MSAFETTKTFFQQDGRITGLVDKMLSSGPPQEGIDNNNSAGNDVAFVILGGAVWYKWKVDDECTDSKILFVYTHDGSYNIDEVVSPDGRFDAKVVRANSLVAFHASVATLRQVQRNKSAL